MCFEEKGAFAGQNLHPWKLIRVGTIFLPARKPWGIFCAVIAKIWRSIWLGVAASSAALAADAVATADSWPMFRGNPGLTGTAPGKLADSLSLQWQFKLGSATKSSAAISDGRVFIGADDGLVYAIDFSNGQKVWTFKTGGPIESSPLVLNGKVYVGSSDNFLYALNAADGKELWKLETGDKILGSPNWVKSPDGTKDWILAGSYDFKLYCVDSGTGKTNWTFETGNYINGSPAVAEGKTVFGGCDALLHVVNLADGQKIKEVEAGAYIAGSGAFEKGKFFIGHYENEFLCADLNEGKIAWKFKDRNFPYFSSPALTSDRVIFGGRDKQLHCLNRANGQQVWSFAARGKVDSSPVVVDGKVVVGSDDGRLYVVNAGNGKEIWNYEIGQPIVSSPAVASGRVVIGGEDGNVYCFGNGKAGAKARN
jgi:eukaryotic-like serine/threonine-protein kinase